MPGRLLTGALAAADRADAAEERAEAADSKVKRADHLSSFGRRLSASLDEKRTEQTIAQMALLERDAWAVVDLLTPTGRLVRLAIVHPDPGKREIAERLTTTWTPRADGAIGYAVAKRAGKPTAITTDVERVLAAAARTPENLSLLHQLGFGACLVVPIRTQQEVDGAITFVSAHPRVRFTWEEFELGERIAAASAHALRNARLYRAVNERRSAAEQSNQSRSDALGHVTHELRTPLNAIGGYAELLQLGLHGPVTPEQVKDLERIRWNQQHLLELIGDILNFVRVDRRRIEYHLTDVSLGGAAREVVEMLEPLFQKKQQRVTFDRCEPGTAMTHADAERVRQIVINLVTNASKYSGDGSHVSILCGGGASGVYVEFADQGPGIAADKLEAIFEPFVQLEGGAGSRGGGVGLGLAIARQLARGMNGDLTVRSTLGKGSTFRLTLPSVPRS